MYFFLASFYDSISTRILFSPIFDIYILIHSYYIVKTSIRSPFFSFCMTEGYESLKEKINPSMIAQLIDHTNLYPTATKEDIEKLCQEAITYNFSSVCISPTRVREAREIFMHRDRWLAGAGAVHGIDEHKYVKVCTVVGFPSGVTCTESKILETQKVISQGASEIDMVVNNGALMDGDFSLYSSDISDVAKSVRDAGGKVLKCIIEVGYLKPEQVRTATECIVGVASDIPEIQFFTKTSTGMALSKLLAQKYAGSPIVGARVEDIEIIAEEHSKAPESVRSRLGIKAAGGVSSYDDALRFLYAMGVRSSEDINPIKQRLGASAGIKIVRG